MLIVSNTLTKLTSSQNQINPFVYTKGMSNHTELWCLYQNEWKKKSSKWKCMKYSERTVVYEAGIILYSILWAKPGDLVPSENTAIEEPVLVMPHQSQEFSMVVSAGQGLWEGWGWCFTGADLRSQQNHQKKKLFFSPFLFNNTERLFICWDRSQSAHLLIIFSNAASLHSYCFSKANYGSSATPKWIIVIPADCWWQLQRTRYCLQKAHVEPPLFL